MGYFVGFAVIASALVLTIAGVNLIPVEYRNWVIGAVLIIAGIIRLRSWWKKKVVAMKKQRDKNELDYLEELILEHEDGIKDRRPQIKLLVREIEKREDLSHRAERLLSDAHVALQLGSSVELLTKLNAALLDEVNKAKK
jgi:hypothetical protein